jgi:hypothetical protein
MWLAAQDVGALAAPVGFAFDHQLVGGGDEPVDGGLGYLYPSRVV